MGLAGASAEASTADGRTAELSFAFAVNALALDEVLQRAVLHHHLHSVVAVGAGLDTRPYRLGLPSDLRWVEIDRDPIFAYKALRLAHVAPTCRVEHLAVDLGDAAERTAALRRAARGVARGLILTEDAFGGLSEADMDGLAATAPRGLKWWLLDTFAPGPAASRSSDVLVERLCGSGWRVAERWPLTDEASRVAPDRLRTLGADASEALAAVEGSAVWLLQRAN